MIVKAMEERVYVGYFHTTTSVIRLDQTDL